MTNSLLSTKLYIPRARRNPVSRHHLMKRLNDGLDRRLTLVSAPAGYGKTTLVSEWIHATGADRDAPQTAWLSLDENDNDPARFLAYLIAALRTVEPDLARGTLSALQASQPQPPPVEPILTALINEIATIPGQIILVLDDYHLIDAQPVHDALGFILQHLPPVMHLVIATRDDPPLPLARLRARGQMTELRATDLRFSSSEVSEFLNRVMGLQLSAENIAALENRTEGWIAGLQLAAISMKGHQDVSNFIQSFSGSHRYILDYLIDEVLDRQVESVQTFLLQTSILDRLTGSLCDAVCFGFAETPDISGGEASSKGTALTGQGNGQATLEALEAANLFIVPLDNERRWYRYHHLFADLLRQRLHRSPPSLSSPQPGETSPAHAGDLDENRRVAELHIRASQWYEENGLVIEAFSHATVANDVARAARLIEGGGMPLTFRGAYNPVIEWLASLPTSVLDATPLLWITYGIAILAAGQVIGVEEKLQAAEVALEGVELDDKSRDLLGRIAATRATMAWGRRDPETIILQSHRALEFLHPDNLPFRTSTTWKLASAYQFQGDRPAAVQTYSEAIDICEASGNVFINILASTGLGDLQMARNQLYPAAETYGRVLQLGGDPPPPVVCGAHLGLAWIHYQWNDLDAAQQHGELALQLARHIESNDADAMCRLFLAQLSLARGDTPRANKFLVEAEQFLRQHNFTSRMSELAAAQVITLLQQGEVRTAAALAEKYDLQPGQARVHLAQGDPVRALGVLELLRQEMGAKGWVDKELEALILQAIAHHALGEERQAAQVLGDALALTETGNMIRIFVNEGRPMAELLGRMRAEGGRWNEYIDRLLAAFEKPQRVQPSSFTPSAPIRTGSQPLIEPLSERETEVLQLIAEGLSNREIAARLYLSLNTVKVHTRNIYGKLGVNKRTQAASRGRELGILI